MDVEGGEVGGEAEGREVFVAHQERLAPHQLGKGATGTSNERWNVLKQQKVFSRWRNAPVEVRVRLKQWQTL